MATEATTNSRDPLLTVRVPRDELTAIRDLAVALDLTVSQLVRRWIREGKARDAREKATP